jgi:hypothetical protein
MSRLCAWPEPGQVDSIMRRLVSEVAEQRNARTKAITS